MAQEAAACADARNRCVPIPDEEDITWANKSANVNIWCEPARWYPLDVGASSTL